MLGSALIILHFVSTLANNQNGFGTRTGTFYQPRQRSIPFNLFYTQQFPSPQQLQQNFGTPILDSSSRNHLQMTLPENVYDDANNSNNIVSEANLGYGSFADISEDPETFNRHFIEERLADDGARFLNNIHKQTPKEVPRKGSDFVINLNPNFVTPLEWETKNSAKMNPVKDENVVSVSADLPSVDGFQQVVAGTLQDFEAKEDTNTPTGQITESNKSHHRGTRAIKSSGMPSHKSHNCHSLNLHKCGTTVIKKFTPDQNTVSKCKIREEFLDCMVKERKKDCQPEEEFSPEETNSTRSQIKKFLWSAHGCLLF